MYWSGWKRPPRRYRHRALIGGGHHRSTAPWPPATGAAASSEWKEHEMTTDVLERVETAAAPISASGVDRRRPSSKYSAVATGNRSRGEQRVEGARDDDRCTGAGGNGRRADIGIGR